MPKYNLFFTNEIGSVQIGKHYETISAKDTDEAITLFLDKVNSVSSHRTEFQILNNIKNDNRPYIAISCEPFSSIEIHSNPNCHLDRVNFLGWILSSENGGRMASDKRIKIKFLEVFKR